MLDADYQASNLPEVVELSDNPNGPQKTSLLMLLTTYATLFDGTLGDWKAEPIKSNLKLGAESVHSRAFPVAHIRNNTFHIKLK